MSERRRPTAKKVATFFLSALLFVISIVLLVFNARAMSIIYYNWRRTQIVTIANTKAQIQLNLLPKYLVRTGTRAMLIVGAGGCFSSFINMMVSFGSHIYTHAWIAAITTILAVAGLLSEYISYYKSSTLVLGTAGTTTTSGYANGWYSVGSWFCQTKTVFADPVGVSYTQACNEDVATRVLIVIYLIISIALCIIAVGIRREEEKLVQLKIEPKRYSGGEMHNVPL